MNSTHPLPTTGMIETIQPGEPDYDLQPITVNLRFFVSHNEMAIDSCIIPFEHKPESFSICDIVEFNDNSSFEINP
jgi:tRNA U34 5-carboxymethylaminomethyl modifying GTPase MnmE/TrmE